MWQARHTARESSQMDSKIAKLFKKGLVPTTPFPHLPFAKSCSYILRWAYIWKNATYWILVKLLRRTVPGLRTIIRWVNSISFYICAYGKEAKEKERRSNVEIKKERKERRKRIVFPVFVFQQIPEGCPCVLEPFLVPAESIWEASLTSIKLILYVDSWLLTGYCWSTYLLTDQSILFPVFRQGVYLLPLPDLWPLMAACCGLFWSHHPGWACFSVASDSTWILQLTSSQPCLSTLTDVFLFQL